MSVWKSAVEFWTSAGVGQTLKQESCAVARKPHNAAAVLFHSEFAENIQDKFKE